ncbi:MAG TPA: chemotaxis protein CheW [Anaeromyxobacteraceae bacterium]|nr:chemotaxis protein CheW [Anaeromyxobacteraceae bacterium]
MRDAGPEDVLLVRAGGHLCAVPVRDVVETMRPLPVSRIEGAPAFVRGAAVIRGEPVPVVGLGEVLGAPPSAAARLVTVRCGARIAALAVEAVLGVRRLDLARGEPLLASGSGAVAALATSGSDLVTVLQASRILPDEASSALPAGAGAR